MNKFLIDNQLYLDFLQISKDQIPIKNDHINKQEFCKLVESQFRKLARKFHPDYGGTNEQFKFLTDCKNKLIEEEIQARNVNLSFDESKFSKYDNSTQASQLGNQIFDLISSWSEEIKLKPLFRPKTNEDEYEWIFKILDSDFELCLNVQNLSDELAEISHDLYKDTSLNILICLFVPSKQMTITDVAFDNSVMLGFDDKIFIESSCSKQVGEYFKTKENIKKDLSDFLSGNFVSKQNKLLKTKKTREVIDKDKKVIEYLQNLKIFETSYDEKAADFLEQL